jgi:hypothetical protein
MPRERGWTLPRGLIGWGCVLLIGCGEGTGSPPVRPDAPDGEQPSGSTLAPVDLVYVCGNKFLATNSTTAPVQVTYTVTGTKERGSLELREGPGGDPGFSETELETSHKGVVELYYNDVRVARRANENLSCGSSAISASAAAIGAPSSVGQWTAPFAWPAVAVHMHLLPSKKVLSWGRGGGSYIWDPATKVFTSAATPSLLFCSGHSFLPDGRLLVNGGHITDDHGLPATNIFNYGMGTWTAVAPMARGRWYPTSTTLANGQVVTLAGRDQAGAEVTTPEVWTGSSWRALTTAKRTLAYYPRTFVAPNGRVFYAGESQTTAYLSTSGTGSWSTVATRRYGTRDYGSAVMYEPGKVLYVGGGRTTNTAEIIDLNQASPQWKWTGSMARARRHLNATLLPTGQVLVTGGTSGTGFSDQATAERSAELWDPATGVWTTLASNAVPRVYHASSLLLPDGRVLHAGSGDGAKGNTNQLTAELFSPPYLFQGTRPTLSSAPSSTAYGSTFFIGTVGSISKVTLIRLGSVTHAFDANQRFLRLSFTTTTGGLNVKAPANGNLAPPGHYMIFVVNGSGVPSVGRVIRMK